MLRLFDVHYSFENELNGIRWNRTMSIVTTDIMRAAELTITCTKQLKDVRVWDIIHKGKVDYVDTKQEECDANPN